jgi:hypothetical protein
MLTTDLLIFTVHIVLFTRSTQKERLRDLASELGLFYFLHSSVWKRKMYELKDTEDFPAFCNTYSNLQKHQNVQTKVEVI